MEVKINENRLVLMTGDITEQSTDAIVNAANGSLLGGGGVDGAIHRAAGKGLLEACKKIRSDRLDGNHLPTGEAVMTDGYHLPARHVIHTVGPIWRKGEDHQEEMLANCYSNSLRLADDEGLSSISFPSISTGVYGYPVEEASIVAIRTLVAYLGQCSFGEVRMVLFSKGDCQVYEHVVNQMKKELG
ncbi:O-acetyl-ADP-ribose deacetylase [Virgibacillus xinjiangensis]|uniref:O-acetyl-ADP-ribose deacetylase n=1 Tax=Virgibacillus xinjiangensis TaxID=393090 RepID=A0ABV7CXD0_9BACI